MNASPASLITRAASTQTYYTIRFLADRDRVDDAYRAYGYFRWVDDTLDAPSGSDSGRILFLERQRSLLESCYRGEPLPVEHPEERMLVELVQQDREEHRGLQIYLRNMMRVMDFDVRRRGRLISQVELNEYTRWLASAVTECIHYFVGHDAFSPHDATRYLAVSAAHIAHMLRDTFDDAQLGYFNVPREVLEAHHIGPQEVHSDAYRDWVKSRVLLAREYFQAGKAYFARVESPRCRLACFAYIARFEWLLGRIETEGYLLRPQYAERKSTAAGLQMVWLTLSSMFNLRGASAASQEIASRRQSKV
jgi:phytoene/squalene synthetase